jgi:hypothetical protein
MKVLEEHVACIFRVEVESEDKGKNVPRNVGIHYKDNMSGTCYTCAKYGKECNIFVQTPEKMTVGTQVERG